MTFFAWTGILRPMRRPLFIRCLAALVFPVLLKLLPPWFPRTASVSACADRLVSPVRCGPAGFGPVQPVQGSVPLAQGAVPLAQGGCSASFFLCTVRPLRTAGPCGGFPQDGLYKAVEKGYNTSAGTGGSGISLKNRPMIACLTTTAGVEYCN